MTKRALSITLATFFVGCGGRDPVAPNDVPSAPRECVASPAPVALAQAELDAVQVAVEPPRHVRLRETVSLGYAGDGPLTQIPPHGQLWYPEEGPVHTYGYGYSGYAYDGYGSPRAARTAAPPVNMPRMGPTKAMGSWGGGRPSSAPRSRR
jgi:hypothetical protein